MHRGMRISWPPSQLRALIIRAAVYEFCLVALVVACRFLLPDGGG
jgi:hypothetical protein